MIGEHRARCLSATLELACAAGRTAGVTRLGEVTAFGVPGIWVYQATRPDARTLAVSQGKGLTRSAAMISALIEAAEIWSAEKVRAEGPCRPLAALGVEHLALWTGATGAGRLRLDAERPRRWLAGSDLVSGRQYHLPHELVALDFTRPRIECVASSNGLATGNTRAEALVAGLAELIEHHAIGSFRSLPRSERRRRQISLDSVQDPLIRDLLRQVEVADFELRAWSQADELGVAAIECTLFPRTAAGEDMIAVAGNGCHPDRRVAFVRALLEAVQTRAALVAGARDDLDPSDYAGGGARLLDLLLADFAFGDGRLEWGAVPDHACASSEECLDVLLAATTRAGGGPVIAYDHEPRFEGLATVHVLAPGLLDDLRLERALLEEGAGQGGSAVALEAHERPPIPPPDERRILFAGPSIQGLPISASLEIRPPAVCGDLAALLASPPAAVALIDGCFKLAPTVWHREILDLIAAGTMVMGGASLGALRACELDRHGMIGIGAIYEAYRGGVLVRDDAVMLDHAPAELGYAPFTLALVDAEHALRKLDLCPRALRMMQRIVRTTPFELRDWRRCLARYEQRTGEQFPVSLAALEGAPSLKAKDARAVIEALEACTPAARGEQPDPRPPLTRRYLQLLARSVPASA